MSSYSVTIGLNYGPDDKRAEVGDVVDDLPEGDIEMLLSLGAIEPHKPKGGKKG